MNKHFLELQFVQGESIQVGNATVTPFSRRLSLGLPEWLTTSKGFAFIYQKPAGVRIEQGGQVTEVPIRDYQSSILAILLLIATVFIFIMHCVDRKEKNE